MSASEHRMKRGPTSLWIGSRERRCAGNGEGKIMATIVQPHHGIGMTESARRIWAIVGGSSGNLVEWYDFYVYSFTALYFASEFFPAGDQTTQLLNAAAVFAAGFLMRPIGSWMFGRIADRRGRRASMMIAVSMMCGG